MLLPPLVIRAPGFRSPDLQTNNKIVPRNHSTCLRAVWDGDGAWSRLVASDHGAWFLACHAEPMAINALRRGADDDLRKPFDGAEFQAALDRTILRLTLARQNAALRRHLGTEK